MFTARLLMAFQHTWASHTSQQGRPAQRVLRTSSHATDPRARQRGEGIPRKRADMLFESPPALRNLRNDSNPFRCISGFIQWVELYYLNARNHRYWKTFVMRNLRDELDRPSRRSLDTKVFLSRRLSVTKVLCHEGLLPRRFFCHDCFFVTTVLCIRDICNSPSCST